jgi:large subunit ribosomal protein L15
MAERGVVRAGKQVKVLGDGELSAAITIRAHAFSKGALEKIAAAGGIAEVIGSAAA